MLAALKPAPTRVRHPSHLFQEWDKDISGEKLILTLSLKSPGHDCKRPFLYEGRFAMEEKFFVTVLSAMLVCLLQIYEDPGSWFVLAKRDGK